MDAPIGFLKNKRFLEPRISPWRVLFALHMAVALQKKQRNQPVEIRPLDEFRVFWERIHWRHTPSGQTKGVGLCFNSFIPVRILATLEHGAWQTTVDTEPFDTYYGQGACFDALMAYFSLSRLGFDETEVPSVEDAPLDAPVAPSIWHPPMELPGPGGPPVDRFVKRRMRPGERAAREAGKASLGIATLPIEEELEDDDTEAVRRQESVKWALGALAQPQRLQDKLDYELNGVDPDTGAILRRVEFED